MKRARLLIAAILSVLALLLAGTLVGRTFSGQSAGIVPAPAGPPEMAILVVAAPALEPWLRAAAEDFNATRPLQNDVPFEIQVVPMAGLTALGNWERSDFGGLLGSQDSEQLNRRGRAGPVLLPAAWVAESSSLVSLANDIFGRKQAQSPLQADGPFLTRSVATSPLAWGFYRSRGIALQESLGEVSWEALRTAAAAPTGWKELGGDPAWGFFEFAIPDPRYSAAGLAAMTAAAGEFYGRSPVSVNDVADPLFQSWLASILNRANDAGGLNASTVEEFALFGPATGDGGLFIESDLLQRAQGIKDRWGDPLLIRYPQFPTWFDFPYAIWAGPETSDFQRMAALAFQRFLLSEPQQREATVFGLRPASSAIPLTAADDSLFLGTQKLGVRYELPSPDATPSPKPEVLLALMRWYDQIAAQ